jgi:hypothetical protein
MPDLDPVLVAGRPLGDVAHPGVRVPHHDRAVERPHQVEGLARLGTVGGQVAETDDLVRAGAAQVGEHPLQRDSVAVDVRNQRDAHG